jgi:hypothetical protein
MYGNGTAPGHAAYRKQEQMRSHLFIVVLNAL